MFSEVMRYILDLGPTVMLPIVGNAANLLI